MLESNSVSDVDVVIVGAGMVGGVLACSLANTGLRVALVEQRALGDAVHAAGERSTALSWGSRQLLDAVGLWADLEGDAAPIERVHVSQQGHLGSVRLAAREHSIDALGYVIKNSRLLAALARGIPQIDNLQLLAPRSVTSVVPSAHAVALVLDNGQRLNTKLLVVADGSASLTCELADLNAKVDDYEQQAVIATLTMDAAPERTAWERFTADGPLALLPLGENSLSLVYTVPQARGNSVMALDDQAFMASIQRSMGRRIGRIDATSARQMFALQRTALSPSWQGRVAVLGNAARTLHPVAGQGFNLALRDTLALAEQLQGLALGQDSGADFVREQFLAGRSADQRETMGLTDALARGFRGHSRLLGHLRGAALIATDRLPLLRRGFARRSMGLAHRIPKVNMLS